METKQGIASERSCCDRRKEYNGRYNDDVYTTLGSASYDV